MLCCILNIKDLNNVPYKNYIVEGMQVFQDTANTVQKNLDESEFTITFLDDNPPGIVEGKTIYTTTELEAIIDDPSNGWVEE
tara:strand:- start:330 stop:575 length:246 start_codon:yes stop_codon:yes gene_type:complete